MNQDTLLSNADFLYVQAEHQKAMPERVIIQTQQSQEDRQGGFTEAWINAYEDVPARLAEVSGREGAFAARLGVDAGYILTVPASQALDETMRVLHKGVTYEVVFVNTGRSHETARRAALKRLDHASA